MDAHALFFMLSDFDIDWVATQRAFSLAGLGEVIQVSTNCRTTVFVDKVVAREKNLITLKTVRSTAEKWIERLSAK